MSTPIKPVRRKSAEIMPLNEGLISNAVPLYKELHHLYVDSRSTVDFFFYNVGTGISLAATGAAGVLSRSHPGVAASLSASAAFFIAITSILNFRGRWRWSLERRAKYMQLIYALNSLSSLLPEDQQTRITELYAEMGGEKSRDKDLPGGW